MAVTLTGSEQRSRVGRLAGASARRHAGGYLFLLPALAYMTVIMLYPVYSNVRMSLHDVNVSTFLAGSAPFVALDNYRVLFEDAAFWKALRVSLIFTAGSLVFQFTIGFLLAVLFNQPFPGNNLFRGLLLLGWLLPTVVSGSIFRWMLDGDFGVINYALTNVSILAEDRYWLLDPSTALAGTILANIWVGIPFNMLLILAGLQGIPPTLYEAASIDGATAWQRFRSITVPLMRPVSLSVLLLGFIYTFKVFDLIYIMTGGGPVDASTVLPIHAYQLTFEFFHFGEGAAAATVLLVGLLVVAVTYLWLSRREEVA
ncbi:MAG: carbohydrate ABC transporter permease [Thermomicrobiales bacterium]